MKFDIGSFKGVESPLHLIDLVRESKTCVPAPDEPVDAKETVVGTLTPEERTLWTARNLTRDTHNAVVQSIAKGKGNVPIQEALIHDPLFRERIQSLGKWHEALDKLFWASVHARFSAQLASPDIDGLGIRSGFEVVVLATNQETFAAMLFDAIAEALGKDGGEHDCAHCSEYDSCDLPIKKSPEELGKMKIDPSKLN